MPSEVIRKVGVAIFKNKKVLLARSKKNAEVFYLPGGKYQLGETDMECMQRELKEELGTIAIYDTIKYLNEFRGVAHNKGANTKLYSKLYTCKLITEPKACSEIAEIKYFDSTIDAKHKSVLGEKIIKWLKENDYIN